jgi:hypothetical protein
VYNLQKKLGRMRNEIKVASTLLGGLNCVEFEENENRSPRI